MFEGLQPSQLPGALEAMLFVTDEPVGALTLSQMLEVELGEVEEALTKLAADLEQQGRGIQLREVAGGWRLFTHPAYHDLVEKYVLSWDTRRMSQAALEVLAVVAYLQPVTRNQISAIR
ncbi:MAG: SMC-Scp complex subunit ScpB, partial [Eggerthellaceae bacterium]|nr:SMC-Scp complex subunit ScpB [Eggerthellaceae bacterium]